MLRYARRMRVLMLRAESVLQQCSPARDMRKMRAAFLSSPRVAAAMPRGARRRAQARAAAFSRRDAARVPRMSAMICRYAQICAICCAAAHGAAGWRSC